MTVFSEIIGQNQVLITLESACAAAKSGLSNQEMTHAWLFTGPPGSGRSNLALAFAAALVCKFSGCGKCTDCETVKLDTHPDVGIFSTEGISIKVDEIRELVSRASWGASIAPWRVMIIEDCDRMTESAANALLKSIEEPGSQTVWILCAPSVDDVLPTIRSRCRLLQLKTPTYQEVVDYLVGNLKITKDHASLVASLSQGHIGRAKQYASNEDSIDIRKRVIKLILSISDELEALKIAADILELATHRAQSRDEDRNLREEELLRSTIQGPSRGFLSGGAKALKELEKSQKARQTRSVRDEVDSFLVSLQAFLRDASIYYPELSRLLINPDMTNELASLSNKALIARLEDFALRVNDYRFKLNSNASQILILETLALDFLTSSRGH
jgi:DNA polymerase-3 subunit delta'